MLVLSRKPSECILIESDKRLIDARKQINLEVVRQWADNSYRSPHLHHALLTIDQLLNEVQRVTVVRIGPNAVKLGIDAAKTANVVREELQAAGPAA